GERWHALEAGCLLEGGRNLRVTQKRSWRGNRIPAPAMGRTPHLSWRWAAVVGQQFQRKADPPGCHQTQELYVLRLGGRRPARGNRLPSGVHMQDSGRGSLDVFGGSVPGTGRVTTRITRGAHSPYLEASPGLTFRFPSVAMASPLFRFHAVCHGVHRRLTFQATSGWGNVVFNGGAGIGSYSLTK